MRAIDALRWSVLGIILLAIASVATGSVVDGATIRELLSNTGSRAPVIFILGYAAAAVLFFPGSVFALAAGALFGPIAGAFYSLTGATLGATAAFLIGRFVAGDWAGRRAGGRLQHFVRGVEAEGWRFVAFVRLVPLLPFNLLNYVLGLTRISLVQYVVTSFVCMVPGALAYTYVGFAGREAALGGEHLLQQGLVAIALLAAVIFLPRLAMRLRRTPIARVDAPSVRQRFDSQPSPLILDVRGPEEYRGGHIAGSLNMPLSDLAQCLSQLATYHDKNVIVVCKTDRRSAKAAEFLSNAGFRAIEVMDGGMESWIRLGYPVSHQERG